MTDSFSHNIMGIDCTVHYKVISDSEPTTDCNPGCAPEVEVDYIETENGVDLDVEGYMVMHDVFKYGEGTKRMPVELLDVLEEKATEDASAKGY